MIDIVKNIRKYLVHIAFTIIAIIAVGSQFQSCNIKKDLLESQIESLSLLGVSQTMSQKISEQGLQISFQEAKYFDEKSKNEGLIERIAKLENTISEFNSETITIVDSVFIPINKIDTIYLGLDSIVNYHFTKRDSNLFFKGYANSQNLFIDTLLIPNKMTLTHKWERKNFLAKKKYLVEVTNSNPYVSVVGLNNYTFVEEKKWHEKRGVTIAFGLVAGYFLFRK